MSAKEKYRLQTVLNVRERAKKDAAQLVVLRRQQLSAAEAELERRQQNVVANLQKQKNAKEEMLDQMREGIEARNALNYRTHLADLREQEIFLRAEVIAQERVVSQAAAEVEKALEFLAQTAKELKVIETHKDNWQQLKRRESEKKEQKLNDEIGAILFQKDKTENNKK